MEQRSDRQPNDYCYHWRPNEYHRPFQGSGGITSGDQPDDQGAGDDNPPVDNGPEVEVGKQYDFTSYAPDGETVYATGVAEQTGEKKKTGDDWFIEVEVKENSVADWVGQKFWIAADAVADGQTKYPLYDAEGNAVGVQVAITAKA